MSSAPRLIACHFGTGVGGQWPRMARVLAWSARQHSPTWSVEVAAITPSPLRVPTRQLTASYATNTQKLEWWAAQVAAAPDGDRFLVLDADTWVTGPLDAAWDQPFDVAYTVRPREHPFPLNAGVVFVRAGARSRVFFRQWVAENRRMLLDRERFEPWRRKYGGLNQAALGALLQQDHGATLLPLPCREWNCEDASWDQFDPAVTKIVHVKSALRSTVFHRAPARPLVLALARRWRECERSALSDESNRQTKPGPLSAPPSAPARRPTRASGTVAFPLRPARRRGRPRGPEVVIASVRVPQDVYDHYCRRSLATHRSVHALLQEAVTARAR